MVDELGFDYGGLMDQKAAKILRQAKLKRPDLSLAVYQMRWADLSGFSETYRDAADLTMFESYLHDQRKLIGGLPARCGRRDGMAFFPRPSSSSAWAKAEIPERTGRKQKKNSNSRFVSSASSLLNLRA